MATPRRCAGCGASLGEPAEDARTVVCAFCGLSHDLGGVVGQAPIVVEIGPRARRLTQTAWIAVLLVVLAISAGGLYVAYRMASTAVDPVVRTVREAPARAPQRVPVSLGEIGTLTEFAWRSLDVAAPPGGFAAFEPIAALPWALEIGRAWATDAVVTRVDVGRVSATGVVDLSGEASSGYRFHSPARALRWKQETDAGATSPTATKLLLEIRGTSVRVLPDKDSRDEPAMAPAASLPLPEILERARRAKGFADRPIYAGYLIHLPREGWVWYFRTPSGDSLPRVRARDARVYPY